MKHTEKYMAQKYFIISGVNKAGTTSLFAWLSAHPDVCASFIKQTFFFLDKEWQKSFGLNAVYDYEKGLNEFENHFRDCGSKPYKAEASPEYLFAPGTPQRLQKFFKDKDGCVIFILRKPVQRFISLYYYGKQQAIIPQQMSFAEFAEAIRRYTEDKNTSLTAYKTCFYSGYLEHWLKYFYRDKIKIYFFEDMIKDGKSLMKKVSDDIGIDAYFYDTFSFEARHKTVAVKSRFFAKLYNVPREIYIKFFYKSKTGFAIAQLLKKTVTRQYRKINMTAAEKEQLPDNVIQLLEENYAQEKKKLESLLGIHVPWD